MSKEAYFGRFDNAATETVDEIAAEMEKYKDRIIRGRRYPERLRAAHKRELETKDSVIQTLSAARDDELDRHRREVDALKREIEATAAKCCQLGRLAGYGASEIKHQQEPVGNAAKLREVALAIRADILKRRSENCWYATDSDILEKIEAALAAPPRNCDAYENDNAIEQFEREILGKEAATTYERLENMRENWFRYNRWLFEKAKESEAGT